MTYRTSLSVCAVAVLVFAVGPSAWGSTYTWNGGAGATWDTSGTNWVGSPTDPWTAGNGPNNDTFFDTSGATPSVSGTVYTNGIEFSTNTSTTISNGTINLAGASEFIKFSNNRRNATINSTIAGDSGFTFSQLDQRADAHRRLTLNGANTYSGVTTVDSDFNKDYLVLRAGSTTAFGPASTASLAFGNRTSQERQIVELYGNDLTLVGLDYASGNNGGGFGQFGSFIVNGGTDDATLTINTATDQDYQGYFGDTGFSGTGTLALVKDGPATLALRGHNTYHDYSGGLIIKEGKVRSNRGGGVWGKGDITLGSAGKTGTMEMYHGSGQSVSEDITLATGGAGEVLVSDSGGTFTLNGVISGAGDLTKTGSGKLRLTGDPDTYTGDTTVSGGTLMVNAAFFDDASTIDIVSGAMLELDHTATDDVGALILGGVTQPLGVYDSSTPGGYLSGSGSLRVVPEPATLALLGLGGLGMLIGRKRRR